MARVQSFLGDFRAALQNEKSTYSIYNSKVQYTLGASLAYSVLCVPYIMIRACNVFISSAVIMRGLKRAQIVSKN